MKLVIFDCDGVLIDSEIISAQVLADELAGLGLPVDQAYVLKHFLGRTYPAMTAEVKRLFKIQLGADFERDHAARLLEAFDRHLKVMPGVRDVLGHLAIPSCVATSSTPARVSRSLALVELAETFAGRVFTASEVSVGKPAPDLFLHVAKQMGVAPSECLVLEDSIAGLQAALNAGMTVWHFTGGSHIGAEPIQLSGGVKPHRTFDSFANFFEAAPHLRKPAPADT